MNGYTEDLDSLLDSLDYEAFEEAAPARRTLVRTPARQSSFVPRQTTTPASQTQVQSAARSNGRTYHMSAAEALLRNIFLRLAGGNMLLSRYNWLYDWKTSPPGSAARPRRGPARAGTAPAHAYSQTCTSVPGAKPSLSSGTMTNPSARVVEDRIDAPPTASGSTSPSTILTRA